jgi:DNA polymerase-3 subunit epsilon
MTYGYAVIDTETTGLTPQGNRIIEIAAVGLRADGSVEGEWSTLLNPDRDLGRTDIHRITAREVLAAPRFPDIAGDLVGLLRGRIIVGHNVRFDVGFVEAEYRRAGHAATIPSSACLCTMKLSSQILPRARRTLDACCAQVGLMNPAAHSALGDARATAALFQRLASAFGGFPGLGRSIGVGQRLAAVELPPLSRRGVPGVQRGQTASVVPEQHRRRVVPMPNLAPGDMVVFTGQTVRPREELERMAIRAGLVPHPCVTRKVTVLVAADPDSLSTKARKAAEYGIPIASEAAFIRMLDGLTG